LLKFGAVARRIGFLGMGRGAKHRDDVELGAMAQRIMHDVIAWPSPQNDGVARHLGL
jgi:hypothetical protein